MRRIHGSWLMCKLLVLLFLSQPFILRGQQTIIHNLREVTYADGAPKEDADGVKNGVVVWQGGGTVHVVSGFFVGSGQRLEIQEGAVIKVAAMFEYSATGQLGWKPPDGTTAITCYGDLLHPSGIVQIESATITDIRDDGVGGDTNQDGSASAVPEPNRIGIRLDIGGNNSSYIKHCTLKFIERITNVGGATISDNQFIMFGSLSNAALTSNPPLQCLDATPDISGNTFEFARAESGGSPVCGVSLTGLSPVIQNNTFRYAAGYAKPANYSGYAVALYVGHWNGTGQYYPQSGITQIRDNRFETGGGISVMPMQAYVPPGTSLPSFLLQRFRVEIVNNTFTAPLDVGGSGGTCLVLPLSAEATVTDNTISNYFRVAECDSTGRTAKAGLFSINRNRFNNCRFFTVIPNISKKNFVNAENNYWGDPSGPYDPSQADGLHNPRGIGTRVPDGVDYAPFTGGGKVATDGVHITAIASPAPPLAPAASVSITVSDITYSLASAPTGKIYITVRDNNGFILNNSDTPISVAAENTTTSFVSTQIKVPELAKAVTVEASLVPDGSGATKKSNIVTFTVAAPPSAFAILSLSDANTGAAPAPIRGNQVRLNINFRYTYTASKVVLNVVAQERRTGSGEIIGSFTPVSSTFAPGTGKTDNLTVPLDIPLRDFQQYPNAELYCQITMTTENGAEIGKDDKSFIISPAGTVRWEYVAAGAASGNKLIPIGRLYYVVGEYYGYGFRIGYDLKAKSASGWSIWVGNDEALDGNDQVLYRFTATAPALSNVATGSQTGITNFIGATSALPPGTKKLRAYLQLKATDNTLAAYATYDIEVRDQPQRTAQKSVPSGSSQLTVVPTPVTLNFASNQTAGTIFVDEYSGPLRLPLALGKKSGAASGNSAWYWTFIPLVNYWSVYDTLKDGSYTARLTFNYNPATDFPNDAAFSEDSLVVAGFNRLSNALEALPSTLDKKAHTISTEYYKFFDTWIVASKATTLLATDVAQEQPLALPDGFKLLQNYPNPFNSSTKIRFQLSAISRLRLTLHDLLGREVALLANGTREAGLHEIEFDGTGLGSGVYFYRIAVIPSAPNDLARTAGQDGMENSFTEVKKLLLVK